MLATCYKNSQPNQSALQNKINNDSGSCAALYSEAILRDRPHFLPVIVPITLSSQLDPMGFQSQDGTRFRQVSTDRKQM